jgi:hypothetical protein
MDSELSAKIRPVSLATGLVVEHEPNLRLDLERDLGQRSTELIGQIAVFEDVANLLGYYAVEPKLGLFELSQNQGQKLLGQLEFIDELPEVFGTLAELLVARFHESPDQFRPQAFESTLAFALFPFPRRPFPRWPLSLGLVRGGAVATHATSRSVAHRVSQTAPWDREEPLARWRLTEPVSVEDTE